MSNAVVCDLCGRIISEKNKMKDERRYVITMQEIKLLKPDTVMIDLCQPCFEKLQRIARGEIQHE